jgi:hypothetical protein
MHVVRVPLRCVALPRQHLRRRGQRQLHCLQRGHLLPRRYRHGGNLPRWVLLPGSGQCAGCAASHMLRRIGLSERRACSGSCVRCRLVRLDAGLDGFAKYSCDPLFDCKFGSCFIIFNCCRAHPILYNLPVPVRSTKVHLRALKSHMLMHDIVFECLISMRGLSIRQFLQHHGPDNILRMPQRYPNPRRPRCDEFGRCSFHCCLCVS